MFTQLKLRMKTYNFWISLVSAIVLVLRIIGDKYNFFVDASLIMDVTTGLCSIFVVLGIISAPTNKKEDKIMNEDVIGRFNQVNINGGTSTETDEVDKKITEEQENIALDTSAENNVSNNVIVPENVIQQEAVNNEKDAYIEKDNVENITNIAENVQPTMQLVENYEDKQYRQTIKKDIVNLLTLLIEKIEEI